MLRLFNAREERWGAGIVLLIAVLGIIVPMLSRYDPLSIAGESLAPPSLTHFFGSDNLGRDVFTRTFSAVRLNMLLALVGVSIPLLIGTLMGAIIGTTRSFAISSFWITVIDAINAFPFIVLVIAIVAIVGQGVEGIVFALAATNWARYAKVARARALVLRDAEFIQAARVLGYSRIRTLLQHILPNVYTETLAYAVSDFVLVIITVSGLSFMGIGVRPPTPEWGAMMADGRLYLQRAWWITMFPGLILSLTAIGVALLAQGVGRWARGDE